MTEGLDSPATLGNGEKEASEKKASEENASEKKASEKKVLSEYKSSKKRRTRKERYRRCFLLLCCLAGLMTGAAFSTAMVYAIALPDKCN